MVRRAALGAAQLRSHGAMIGFWSAVACYRLNLAKLASPWSITIQNQKSIETSIIVFMKTACLTELVRR
jgi:hypothetical protein